MSKKDRVAIVFTVFYIMLIIAFILEGGRNGKDTAFMLMPLPVIYWGIRFIKNDISFMKSKGD
jgi:hypothetical protein